MENPVIVLFLIEKAPMYALEYRSKISQAEESKMQARVEYLHRNEFEVVENIAVIILVCMTSAFSKVQPT